MPLRFVTLPFLSGNITRNQDFPRSRLPERNDPWNRAPHSCVALPRKYRAHPYRLL